MFHMHDNSVEKTDPQETSTVDHYISSSMLQTLSRPLADKVHYNLYENVYTPSISTFHGVIRCVFCFRAVASDIEHYNQYGNMYTQIPIIFTFLHGGKLCRFTFCAVAPVTYQGFFLVFSERVPMEIR